MSGSGDLLTYIIAIISAISGWLAFSYQYFSAKPKIKGKILQVMRGQFPNPKNPSELLTVFVLFVYLTNDRKNALHIRDYILEVNDGTGFEKMGIIRGDFSNLHFGSKEGEIIIPDFEKGVIYKQSKPVEYGTPYYGYLLFGGNIKYYKSDISLFKITCVDVFDNKHTIVAKPKTFVNLFYLQEVFKIKFPNRKSNNETSATNVTI